MDEFNEVRAQTSQRNMYQYHAPSQGRSRASSLWMGFRCYTQNTNICFHNLATIPMSPSPQPSSPPPPPNLITPHRSTRWPAQTATSLAVSPGHPQHPQKRVSRRSRFLVRYSIRIILSCALAAIGLVSLVSTSGPTDVRFSGRSGLTGQAGLSVGVSACGWVYGLSQVSGRDRFHGLRGTNMCLGDIDSSRDLGRDHNMLMLDHLGECLRGETRCPERPIILSNYNYIGFLYEGYTPPGGEMIWLGSAVSRSVPIQVHRWITDV